MSVELITLIGVVITAVAAVSVALINLWQNRKIQEIHVLVNDRLDAALAKIDELKVELVVEKARNGL